MGTFSSGACSIARCPCLSLPPQPHSCGERQQGHFPMEQRTSNTASSPQAQAYRGAGVLGPIGFDLPTPTPSSCPDISPKGALHLGFDFGSKPDRSAHP